MPHVAGPYAPRYSASHALLIGINNYRHASPLAYARQDAQTVADVLIARHGFPKEQLTLLLDEEATRAKILSAFLRYSDSAVSADDRIVVFFAGHGYTRPSQRGDTGYLVPADGTLEDLSTLIRWDELTRNADLIIAKHLLFIMDACYGGLALQRAPAPGSMRFLKDMLQRYGRQVLTAGKGNEVVADSGGPRPDHSIFTGHLLDALEGKAAQDGIVTATALMTYVYNHVANDQRSRQTPHFGFFDGDGDLVLSAPELHRLASVEDVDADVMIETPATQDYDAKESESLVDEVKECVAEPRFRIRLDDLISRELRKHAKGIQAQDFSLQERDVTASRVADRLEKYEIAVGNLEVIVALLARWGTDEHLALLSKVLIRLAEHNNPESGLNVWLAMRWYPCLRVLYSSGIASLVAANYQALAEILLAPVQERATDSESLPNANAVIDGARDSHELFKLLPGHERNYIPRSEYLFKSLQPNLEDLFFLGRSYEQLFDEFEVLLALAYADRRAQQERNPWGPIGRYGWKWRSHGSRSPFEVVVADALRRGADWGPIKAGMFGGSIERFETVASAFRDGVLAHLGWY